MKVLYPRNIGYRDVITRSHPCLTQSKERAGATGALWAHGFSRDQSLALSGLTETYGGSEGIPRSTANQGSEGRAAVISTKTRCPVFHVRNR